MLLENAPHRIPTAFRTAPLNWGGLYRLTPNQQLDFHVALGLNHNAPSYIVGVGYSVRFDELFPVRRSSHSIAPRN